MNATEERNAFQLASLAGCGSPDAKDSAGARWLLRVASELEEDRDLNDLDWIHEAADEAVPIYTYDVWTVFVDLAAYQEDVSDFGPVEDMEQAAKVALYLIAERLLHALAAEAKDED